MKRYFVSDLDFSTGVQASHCRRYVAFNSAVRSFTETRYLNYLTIEVMEYLTSDEV